ncbi:MAG: hypothetical protein ABIR71_14480 [Chthoniobacterales bacterium]
MNEETEAIESPPRVEDHWSFLRDVAVFQLKMVVDNLRDFALIPVSLGAAAIDLIFKSELFYGVLRWGAESEKIIDVYSPLGRRAGAPEMGPAFTIDAAVARLESVVVRECEKGGTAASIKAAMDRAIAQLHKETGPTRDKATDLVTRAADKMHSSVVANQRTLKDELRIMKWSAGREAAENAERPTPKVARPNEGDEEP